VAALAVVAVGLAWRSLGWPLVHDAPIMHYIAWRIAEGAVPYRDLFDMNFPGVYLFHLAVVKTIGTGDAASRAADLTVTALGAVMVAALAAPWGRAGALGGGLFFAAYHLAGGAWNAGQRDFLLAPLLLAGALGVACWTDGGRAWSVFAGGVALGAALTIKPHVIVLVTALAVFVVVRARRTGGSSRHAVAALIGGAVLVPAAAVAWVAALGALGAWRDIVFGYLVPLYSRVTRPADWLYFRWHVWVAIIATVALSLASLIWGRRLSARHGVVMLGLGYGVVHFVAQRKGWEYHLYPLVFFLCALAAPAGEAVMAAGAPRAREVARAAAIVLFAATAMVLGAKAVEAMDAQWIDAKARRVAAITRDLGPLVPAGGTAQVLDVTAGGIHALFRLQLRQPTRFLYDFHFFHDEGAPRIQGLRAELVRGLEQGRPAAVVVLRDSWLERGYDRLDRFPELRDLLARCYSLAVQGDDYRIYAKRSDS